MSNGALPYDALAASQELAAADPRLAETIAAVGPPSLALRPDETLPALVRAVVYQQLSGKAAATIHGRLLAAAGDDLAGVLALPPEALRACGLSRAKVESVRDLAAHHADGRLPSRDELISRPDDEIVRRLSEARGVGVWTVQMFLLFNLGRPDVWPTGDLGVQEGYRLMTASAERPTPRALADAGEAFRPWRSVAAWYLWREVDRRRAERDPSRDLDTDWG